MSEKMLVHSMSLLSAITPVEGEDNMFSKQILPYGKVAHPQNPKIKVNFTDKIFDDLIEAYEAGVIENVALMSGTHDDGNLSATVGTVVGLYKESEGLFAKLEILDQNTLTLIQTKKSDGRRLLSGVSVSIASATDAEGKEWPHVLFHVALTHQPHITDMQDFIQLFIGGKDDFYLADGDFEKSLDERSNAIRRAFYNHIRANITSTDDYYYRYWVKDVYDNFVIVMDDDSVDILKFSYIIDDNNDIIFDEPVVVEIEYRERKKQMEMTEKDVLEFFKTKGIEADSVDFFINLQKEKDDEIKKLTEDKDKEIEVIKATLTSEQNEKLSLSKRVEALEASKLTMEATAAVDKFVNLGKIAPVQKETYINLYKSDSDMFSNLMENQPVIVDVSERGYDSTAKETNDDFGMDAQKVKDEIERYSNMSTMKESK